MSEARLILLCVLFLIVVTVVAKLAAELIG